MIINLVEFSTPSVHTDLDSDFILKNGEKIIDEINYRNAYYLLYLFELAKEMKLIKEMPSIGTSCFIPSKGYEEFLKISKEEQLYKVVDNSINVCVKRFNEQPMFSSKLTRKKVMNMLDNGVIDNKYLEEIDNNLSFMETFANKARNLGIDKVKEELSKSNPLKITEMLSEIYFGIYIDMWFISIFGYYLGIIIPNYIQVYDVCQSMNDLTMNDNVEKLVYMFDMNQAHDLTPLGEKIMSLFKKVEAKKNFKNIEEDEFDEILVDIKEEMDLVLSGEFEENMDFFCTIYLSEVSDGLVPKAHLIDTYMGYYIRKVATSKTNVKEQLVSLKHYANYMESIGLIDNIELDKIKEICKEKDHYANNYEEYWDM